MVCERPPRPLHKRWLRAIFLNVASTPAHEGNNILDASCTQIKGEILKSDKSCISNPKSEMSDWTGTSASLASYAVQSEFSDFRFEMQDLSDFEMSFSIDESSMLVPSRGGEYDLKFTFKRTPEQPRSPGPHPHPTGIHASANSKRGHTPDPRSGIGPD